MAKAVKFRGQLRQSAGSLATLLLTMVILLTAMAGTAGAALDEGPPNAGANPSISADGRYVAFGSRADDLSAEDNDSVVNIFVRDLQTNTVTLVSRSSGTAGVPADLWSESPSISADGRYVAFMSVAHNVSGEDNNLGNIFVRDLQSDTTTFVSRANGISGAAANGGSEAPTISADGRYVAFQSLAVNLGGGVATKSDVFVRDLQTNTTTLISRTSGASGAAADGHSRTPSISADGRYVAFDSDADNLSAEDNDSATDAIDIFVRDLQTNTTTLVSRASGVSGAAADRVQYYPPEPPSISADGRFVAFFSQADNLSAEDLDFVGVACFPGPYGTWCVDVRVADIFVRDLQAYTTTFASRASGAAGAAADYGGDLSAVSSGLVSHEASISADGRFVAFSSEADNLSAGDNDDVRDVFVRDLQTNSTTFVSRASGVAGQPFHDDSGEPSISADGRLVAFSSRRCGTGEIEGIDIYVRDLQSQTTTWVGRDPLTGVCPTAPPSDATPPKTKITKHPKNKVVAKVARVKVRYAFKSSESGSRFKCKRDKKAWKACTSPKRYRVKPAKHKFQVRATDAAGNTDPSPAKDKFKVVG